MNSYLVGGNLGRNYLVKGKEFSKELVGKPYQFFFVKIYLIFFEKVDKNACLAIMAMLYNGITMEVIKR